MRNLLTRTEFTVNVLSSKLSFREYRHNHTIGYGRETGEYINNSNTVFTCRTCTCLVS